MEISKEQILAVRSAPEQKTILFNQIMSSFQSNIFHFVRRMTSQHDDAWDITQNTFLKAWQHLDQFSGKSKFSTWLYQIAYHEALHFIEKQKRSKDRERSFAKVSVPFSQSLEATQMLQWLYEAIDELPPQQKAVFALRYFEEKKYEEIHHIMGTSVGALKTHYHLAVKKIESFLITKNHLG